MGASDDPAAVLDSRMKVRGLANLRVCDMSAAPNIEAGNINTAAMMLGDRCADFVSGEEWTTSRERTDARVFPEQHSGTGPPASGSRTSPSR